MIMERKLQPVIIFSFSRRECEALAMDMSKLDFNTGEGWREGGCHCECVEMGGVGVRV